MRAFFGAALVACLAVAVYGAALETAERELLKLLEEAERGSGSSSGKPLPQFIPKDCDDAAGECMCELQKDANHKPTGYDCDCGTEGDTQVLPEGCTSDCCTATCDANLKWDLSGVRCPFEPPGVCDANREDDEIKYPRGISDIKPICKLECEYEDDLDAEGNEIGYIWEKKGKCEPFLPDPNNTKKNMKKAILKEINNLKKQVENLK